MSCSWARSTEENKNSTVEWRWRKRQLREKSSTRKLRWVWLSAKIIHEINRIRINSTMLVDGIDDVEVSEREKIYIWVNVRRNRSEEKWISRDKIYWRKDWRNYFFDNKFNVSSEIDTNEIEGNKKRFIFNFRCCCSSQTETRKIPIHGTRNSLKIQKKVSFSTS